MKKFIYVLLGLSAFTIVWNSVFFPVTRFRYRLTIELNTPQGPRIGSAIHEYWQRDHPSWMSIGGSAAHNAPTLHGEAVFIDLGEGKAVFGILDFDLFNVLKKQGDAGPLELKRVQLPNLITFTDMANPASAKVVYGGRRSQDLFPGAGWQGVLLNPVDEIAATFGPGHAFKRATVEMVPAGIWPFSRIPLPWPQGLFGAPITRGIEGRLVWRGMKYDDMRNTDGSPLSLNQKSDLIDIMRALERKF